MDEYFEMNQLDASHTIDNIPKDVTNIKQSVNQDNAGNNTLKTNNPEQTEYVADNSKENTNTQNRRSGKIKIIALLVLLGISLSLTVGTLMFILLSKNTTEDNIDRNFDRKPTDFVTDSDSPGIDLITEDVLGTGMLFEDCDILSEPDEKSKVVGNLSALSDVMVYAADGEYYKISDPDGKVVGYVLKEKVNTGGIDLGNPDASAEKNKEKNGNAVKETITYTTVNPEDFPVNSSPYFIYVEKGSHTITIFGKDENGKYTVPRRTFLTATGSTASMTPVGDFTILAKERWHSWGNCYSPYCCKYYGGLFFHGPLYGQKNFGTLERWSVNQIGTNASSGCLRTSAQAAYFIYQFCWVGTNVKIVNGSPLGRSADKPTVDSQYVDPATNMVPVAEISFDFDSKTMHIGESIKATAKFTPSSASNKDCTWSSSDRSVASVSGKGASCTVKALSQGSAVITARSIDGGYKASFTVNVISEESSEISSDISSDGFSAESEDVSSAESEDISSAPPEDSSSTGDTSDTEPPTTETTFGQETTTTSSASEVPPENTPLP